MRVRLGPIHGRQRQRQQNVGEGQHRVGEPGQDGVNEPAEVARHQADDHAQDHRDGGGDDADEQRDAGAVEDADEQVPAGGVGAEPEPVDPRADRVAERVFASVRIGGVHTVAGDDGEQRGGDGQDHHHDDDAQRDHRHPVAAQPAPGQLPLSMAFDGAARQRGVGGGAGLVGGLFQDAHADSPSARPALARVSPGTTGK